MKKIILLFLASLLCLGAFAQARSELGGSIVLKGGYNFLEKQPVSSVCLFGDFAFLRVSFNFSYAIVPNDGFNPTPTPAFWPAIGACYGDKGVVYLMCGAVPFRVFDKEKSTMLSGSHFRVLLEFGYDVFLSKHLFLNICAHYALPAKDTEKEHFYQNLSLMGGFGFRF